MPNPAIPSRVLEKLRWPALCVLSTFFLSMLSHAQTCALCYTQAAASGSRIIHGLRSGILILVIPPMFMSIGITILAYRKRNQFSGPASGPQSPRKNGW